MEAFVYCWTDHNTNKLYVGCHKGTEDDGYVCSSKLMMEQYRERPQDFTRQIIASGSYKDIRKLEAKILESIGASQDKQFYNQHNGNGNFYCKGHTNETKRKIGLSSKGIPRSEHVKEKISLGNLGKICSEETKRKISIGNRGKKKSEETLLKMSEKQSGSKNHFHGKNHSEKTRKLISLNHKDMGGKNNPMFNKTHSIESRTKMSNSRKGMNLGVPKSKETKQKMSEARKKYWDKRNLLSAD